MLGGNNLLARRWANHATLPIMLSSRTLITLTTMLASVATTGCPLTVTVHMDTAEMTRAAPLLARRAASRTKIRSLWLTTQKGVEVSLDQVVAPGWRGDDGSFMTGGELPRTNELSFSPDFSGPFSPPRGGTWTFQVVDDTALSKIGKYTTLTGGVGVALMAAVLFFTAAIIGPQPSFDVDKAFRTEGRILLGSVSVATAGGILWAAGNLAFRHKPAHLGEGVFRFGPPQDSTLTPGSSGGYFGGF